MTLNMTNIEMPSPKQRVTSDMTTDQLLAELEAMLVTRRERKMSKMSETLAASIANDIVKGLGSMFADSPIPLNENITSQGLVDLILEISTVSDEEVEMVEEFMDSEVYLRYTNSMADIVNAITTVLFDVEEVKNKA